MNKLTTDQIHGPYEEAKNLRTPPVDPQLGYYRARVKVTIYQDCIVYCQGVNTARDNAIRIAKARYPQAEGFVCRPEDVKREGESFSNGGLACEAVADKEEQ